VSIKDNIEDLFKSEDLEQSDTEKPLELKDLSELSKIELPAPESSEIEKREFTRIDVKERQISVRFHNEMQFARHYLENISVGGIFVKTSEKYKLGDLVPIEFEVQTAEFGTPELFQFKGKVCRVIADGVGLEFTNLDQITRARLESYIQSILPRGSNIRTKAKQSTVERLEQMRQERDLKQSRNKKIALQLVALVVLGLANGLLVQQQFTEPTQISSTREEYLEINGKRLKWNEIRSLGHQGANQIELKTDTESHFVDTDQLNRNAPPHIRHQLMILRSTPPQKVQRRSKNSRDLIEVRELNTRKR
jgi:Tfp pilus assembly protein PilZ